MAAARFRKFLVQGNLNVLPKPYPKQSNSTCIFCQWSRLSSRRFATSARVGKDGTSNNNGRFRSRLRAALKKTKVEWKPIPVGLGIGFLGAIQFYRVQERERRKQDEEDRDLYDESEEEQKGRPKKRKRIRPSGPWYEIHLSSRYDININ